MPASSRRSPRHTGCAEVGGPKAELTATRDAKARLQMPTNKVGIASAPKNNFDSTATARLGSNAASRERICVLAILRAAYSVARGERQRIQTDLDLLVGIARAVEADIYDPAFALERALEHGLVAWPDAEVAP
jgi:hypothetical protein